MKPPAVASISRYERAFAAGAGDRVVVAGGGDRVVPGTQRDRIAIPARRDGVVAVPDGDDIGVAVGLQRIGAVAKVDQVFRAIRG